ncbi:MAG: MFS transporter [Gemmataceae bacterium]
MAVDQIKAGRPAMLAAAPALQRSWIGIVVAAFAMTATLPGRTHGLGLITVPLTTELQINAVDFAFVNLLATLIGAVFCVPCGWLLDRIGGRWMVLAVAGSLSGTVVAMSFLSPTWGVWLMPALFGLVLLTRGLGQSALSVVSLAIMGRASGGRTGIGVGVYSFLVAIGFMAAFSAVKYVDSLQPGWRSIWLGIGAAVAVFAVVGSLLMSLDRSDAETRVEENTQAQEGLTLAATLMTPAFWVYAGATSLYGLIAAGVSLFNQSILADRGFDRDIFLTVTAATPMIGLAANLATGFLATRIATGKLMALAMTVLAGALLAFPLVTELYHVYLYAAAMGIAGGMVTVLFFGIWAEAFGTRHLGKIQGAAQMMTVFASAAGPLLLAWGNESFGSYVPVFRGLAIGAALFAVAALVAPLPRRDRLASDLG